MACLAVRGRWRWEDVSTTSVPGWPRGAAMSREETGCIAQKQVEEKSREGGKEALCSSRGRPEDGVATDDAGTVLLVVGLDEQQMSARASEDGRRMSRGQTLV